MVVSVLEIILKELADVSGEKGRQKRGAIERLVYLEALVKVILVE